MFTSGNQSTSTTLIMAQGFMAFRPRAEVYLTLERAHVEWLAE